MKSKKVLIPVVLILSILLLLSGCSIFERMLRRSVRDSVREEAEESVESAESGEPRDAGSGSETQSAQKAPDPQWNNLMISQAQMIFPIAFSGGGFYVGQREYEPGEYTIFEWVSGNNDPVTMEKAFLKITDDGRQWWRISWTVDDDSWTYEVLLDPEEERMVRLRARDMDGVSGEIPVTDQSFYVPPAEITEESVSGATVGTERITTPAGTFQADHVVFAGITGGGDMEWWLSKDVPGGVVKYLLTEGNNQEVWSSALAEYGSDAVTRLDSF